MTDDARAPLDAAADMDEISLCGMQFHVCVGILPHEQEFPQPLEIDVTVWKTPGGEVVDYRLLYDVTRRVVTGGELGYLERIGERIAEGVLRDQPVRRVRVAIRKPHVPLPGPLDHAAVTVVRNRHG